MPKHLTDEQILAAIQAVREEAPRVTGMAVRNELRRLYGSPGGVDRIYKLMEQRSETVNPDLTEQLQNEVALLKEQLSAAIQRAELAEHREQAHQEKWAMEIDQLRQQLRAAQSDSLKLREAQSQLLELRRELHRVTNNS